MLEKMLSTVCTSVSSNDNANYLILQEIFTVHRMCNKLWANTKCSFHFFYWATFCSTITNSNFWSNTMTEAQSKPSINAKNVKFTTNYRTSGFILDTWTSYVIVFIWFVNSEITQMELLVRGFSSITPVFEDGREIFKESFPANVKRTIISTKIQLAHAQIP